MAKNKKKHSASVIHQRQQKLLQAQGRGIFENKMRALCAMLGDKSLYDRIPPKERDFMYQWRGLPLKVELAEGCTMPEDSTEIIAKVMRDFLDTTSIELIPGSGKCISLSDYYFIALSMENVLKCKTHVFAGKERFDFFMKDAQDRLLEYEMKLYVFARRLCSSFDSIVRNQFYTCFFSIGVYESIKDHAADKDKNLRLWHKITIDFMQTDEKQMKVDGKTITVKQVGAIEYDSAGIPKMAPVFVTPQRLKINGAADRRIPIYITHHAIDRLMERSGCQVTCLAITSLISSIAEGECISIPGKTFLIEYRIKGHKIGYIVGELTDGILLLRTFRLLTHPATPEGVIIKMLAQAEEAYEVLLQIDSLRPLLESHIMIVNDVIAQLFIDAGCQGIVDLCREVCAGNGGGFFEQNKKNRPMPDLPADVVMKNRYKGDSSNEEFLV
jgi:hypothetical protein